MFIIFTTGWILYNVMREKSWIQRHGVALLRYSRCKSFPRLADNLQQVLYICTVSLKGLELIHRTWTGSCHKSTFLYSWTCNPDVDMGMFPMDTGFMLMVTRLSRVEGAKLGEAVNRSLPTDKVCCKVEDEVITTDPDLGGRSPVSRFRSMRVGSLSGNWIREASRANLLAISDPSFISNLRLKISPKHNRVNPSNVGEEKTVNAFSPRRWRRSSSSASNEDRSVMSITPRWWKGSVANDNDSVQDRIDTKTEFGGDQSVAPNDLDTISEKSATS
eukprot:gene6279-6757_t